MKYKNLLCKYLECLGLNDQIKSVSDFFDKSVQQFQHFANHNEAQEPINFYVRCCCLAMAECISDKVHPHRGSSEEKIKLKLEFEGRVLSEFHSSLSQVYSILPSRLVFEHQHLIRKAAATYHITAKKDDEAQFQDLLSVGWESLFASAQKYFFQPQGSFRSFAWKNLKEAIRKEQDKRSILPTKVRKKLSKLSELREELTREEIPATFDVLCQRLQVSGAQLEDLLSVEIDWGNGQEIESTVEMEDLEAVDQSQSALSMLIQKSDIDHINLILSSLEEADLDLVKAIFFEGWSIRGYAETKAIPFKTVKKHYKKILTVLKDRMSSSHKTG